MTSKSVATFRFALLIGLALICLWNNAVLTAGWCREWISQNGETVPFATLFLAAFGSGVSHETGLNLWVSQPAQRMSGVAFARDMLVWVWTELLPSFINNFWSAMTTLQNFSLKQKIAFLATSYSVLCHYIRVAKLVWTLLWPVRFGLELLGRSIATGSYYLVLYLTFPIWAPYFAFIWLYKKYIEYKEWLMAQPELWTAWMRGQLATTVILPGGETVEVSLMDKLDSILAILRQGQNYMTLEAKQAGSEFIKAASWPKGLVIVRDHNGMARGMGFLTLIGGKHAMVTAAHVAMYCKNGIILSAGLENKHVTIAKEAKLLLQSTADVVAVEIPVNTAGLLGVGRAKIGRTAATGLPVTVFGYVKGEFVSALGVMGAAANRFKFQHNVSTVKGFSGSPIYRDSVICGIHLSSNGIGENFGLSLDFIAGQLERNDYDGKRHMREQEEFDDDFTVNQEREQEDDIIDYELLGEENIRTARSAKQAWSSSVRKRVETDVIMFREKALMGLSWSDDVDSDWENTYIVKEAVNFRFAPKRGDNTTIGQTDKETKSTPTTSEELDISTSSTQEVKATRANLPKKKKKKSRRSKTGNGPVEESKPSETVSECTPANLEQVNGTRTSIVKTGSKPKSWTQSFTQELKVLLGTGLGFDEAEKLAKTKATEMFPRSPGTTSKVSETSSTTTL